MKMPFFYLAGVILCILFLPPTDSVAQQSSLLKKTKCNSWRGSEIGDNVDALCFSIEGVVQEVFVDSTHSMLYVSVRDTKRGKLQYTGKVAAYDFNQDLELWSIPFDYRNDQFFLADRFPVISGKYHTAGIDRESGTELWKVDLPTGLVAKGVIGLAKDYRAIVGLDLNTGKELWRKPAASYEDIGSFEIHGDTAAIFLSSGLNLINLNSGEGFYIKAKTLEFERSQVAVGGAIMAGAVLGGLLGAALVSSIVVVGNSSSGSAKHRADVSLTDLYIHKEGIIFTSKTELYNVKFDGDVAWSVPVAKAIGPIRKVFVVDEAVFMISKGMINTQNGPIYSDAVLYRMNLNGNESILGVKLNSGKREYVQDFIINDSTIIVALNNKLVEISLNDLRTLQEQSFGNVNQNAGFGTILNPPTFLFNDSIFELASKKYPNDFFVANRGGMKIRFSEELSPVEVIRQPNYFALSQEITEQRMFVTNGTDVYLINTSGEKLSDFSFSPQMQYIGGRVFDYEDNRIVGIKL